MVSGHQPRKHLSARDNEAKNRDFQLISRKGELAGYKASLAGAPASTALGGVGSAAGEDRPHSRTLSTCALGSKAEELRIKTVTDLNPAPRAKAATCMMCFETGAVQQLPKSSSSTSCFPNLSALSCQDIELVKKGFSLNPTDSHLERTPISQVSSWWALSSSALWEEQCRDVRVLHRATQTPL